MTQRISTLLIDDEPPARQRLAKLLAVHPQIEIVGEAWDIESACEIYMRERPALLFLDIQLPQASGFDLIPLIGGSPAIIFVTAYEQFALQAFDVNALDYLLKPVHPDRLAAALKRLKIRPEDPERIPPKNDQVALQEDRELRFVPAASITHIEAQGNYTLVHLAKGPSALIRRPLSEWEKELSPQSFLRIGRSLLVQITAIRSLSEVSRDVSLLTLAGRAKPIHLGRRTGALVRRAIGGQ